MNHLYPVVKGDQLCPLGFHPQVRWPTRCKRCFRDYKEHGNKRMGGDDITSSSPAISDSSSSRFRDQQNTSVRSWTSTQNLSESTKESPTPAHRVSLPQRPASWANDDDEGDGKNLEITVNVQLPRRRLTTNLADLDESVTMKPPQDDSLTISQNDSLAERVRKMQLLKRQSSLEKDKEKAEAEPEKPRVRKRTANASTDTQKANKAADLPPPKPPAARGRKEAEQKRKAEEKQQQQMVNNSKDVEFLMAVKNSTRNEDKEETIFEDAVSNFTETTETTLVDNKELQEEIESLKRELDSWKSRCERAERDKSDILLRRISSMDVASNRTAASEVLKLQQKVNELKSEVEELRDEKRSFAQRVKELEHDLEARPSKNVEEMLRAKLEQAESLCEELMDENEEIKKEMRTMEQEMDEMHDNFREDQADEYSHLKKELEQASKNCRILSFKLKKSDRKIEQLEHEKQVLGGAGGAELAAKVTRLEEELRVANEVARRMQKEAESPSAKKKAPSLGNIGRSSSADTKVARSSLMRSGSQEDPAQLLRDLQDSLEREADLREQLKFAEEEAETLRAKVSRIEDENESLVMQLKKMATKNKSRRLSPNPPASRRLTPEPPTEKDEGISDEEDPAELRLQLELNEQEMTVLRRKLQEAERDSTLAKQKIKDLEGKLDVKTKEASKSTSKLATKSKLDLPGPKDPLKDKKLAVMEDEINDLRKKVIEKDREIERLEAEASLTKTKPKSMLQKAKTLDITVTEQQNLDFKRQLQLVEQEASVLRSKTQKLEQENEKLVAEVKKLQLQVARGKTSSKDKGLNEIGVEKTKEALDKLEKDRDELTARLRKILEEPTDKLPVRVPKKYSESFTKQQLKTMLEELEEEVLEMRARCMKSGNDRLKEIEEQRKKLEKECKDAKEKLTKAEEEIKSLKSNSTSSVKAKDIEDKLKKVEKEKDDTVVKLKILEDKCVKLESSAKQAEALKGIQELQLKQEREKNVKIQVDCDKERREKARLESRNNDLEKDLQSLKSSSEKVKTELEKEIVQLKSKSSAKEPSSKRLQELRDHAKELEEMLIKENQRYTDLHRKYELLEEQRAVEKVRSSSEKENLEVELRKFKLKVAEKENSETKLTKENAELSKKVAEMQKQLSNRNGKEAQFSGLEMEKNRLKAVLDSNQVELAKVTRENDMNKDQAATLRRENDDLKRKLDDFERINKAQRSVNEATSSLEKEIKNLKIKLENAEMAAKSEVASTRLRYEQQANHLQAELASLQRQTERFKRDRDTYKQLLEAAQKQIGDLKTHRRSVVSVSSSGDEDDKSKILALEQQVNCLEDELSEARLEGSKLRTELVSEKSAADVKISELQSRLNEVEEERILGSGRTRLSGTKTKLELSWQKEREDQQRLVQETATLARDLRQTLFEVERERDKERLEAKRKVETIKRATEEEMEEGRKKISELQADLLELRDAHAKLRTANEKLRRDRERYERERDHLLKKRLENDSDKKVGALLQTVDELVKFAPELQMAAKQDTSKTANLPIPTPPNRTRSKSPSPSPSTLNITNVLARLAEASEELRRFQRLADEERERERARRSGMRRAASTEADGKESPLVSRSSRVSRNGSLHKKSLSLDQSMNKDQQIWKQDSVEDTMSSMQSIDSEIGFSEGSTQSDMPRHYRKKKRTLMGKLRSLTSRKGSESDFSQRGSDSDLSLYGDQNSSKKDLSKRLTGMFKRAGSSSRSNSVEKNLDSTQRPVSMPLAEKPTASGSAKPPMPSTPSQVVLRKRISK